MGRINKGLRLPQDVLARAAHLRTYHPEYATEAAMLNAILYCGLLVIEAEVLAGGGAPPPGYTPQQITAMALPRLLPALRLIIQCGLITPPGARVVTGAATDARDSEEVIDEQTGEYLGRLGSNFL